jgi:hypothetical protein
MLSRIKSFLVRAITQAYRSDHKNATDDQFHRSWDRQFVSTLGQQFYWLPILVVLVPVISIYYLAPDAARWPLVLTYSLMFLELVYLAVKKQRPVLTLPVYVILSQIALIGHAWSFRLIMSSSIDLEYSMIICAMYTTMGFLFVILAPFANGLSPALALEHVGLAYYSWGTDHPSGTTLAWILVLISFDSFGVGFHVLNYRRLRRHTLLELSAKELQVQNERLRVESIEKEMHFARKVQDSLAPKVNEMKSDLWQVRFFHRRHDILGGDWMGARILGNGNLILAIADVTGKGVAASMVAQAIHALWALALTRETFDAESWLKDLNHALFVMGHTELHTATIGLAVVGDTQITYYSCAHVPLFICSENDGSRVYAPLTGQGTLVGLSRDFAVHPVVIDWRSRGVESILLGTDGIFDRGGSTRARKISALLSDIETKGSEALDTYDVDDDKLLIWVRRLPH